MELGSWLHSWFIARQDMYVQVWFTPWQAGMQGADAAQGGTGLSRGRGVSGDRKLAARGPRESVGWGWGA